MASSVEGTSPTLAARLGATAVEVVQQICRDTADRKRDRTVAALGRGIFYPLDYFSLLTERRQTPRIDWLRDRDVFCRGFAKVQHWEQARDGTGSSPATDFFPYAFVLKQGVRPSEALQSLRDGPSLLDCTTVCQIGHYEALRQELGDGKFDSIFARGGPTPLFLDRYDSASSFWGLRGVDRAQRGDMCFFKGVQSYVYKHPTGTSGAFHVLRMQSDEASRFVGFGLDEGGLTSDEVVGHLAAAWNKDPDTSWLGEDMASVWPHLKPATACRLKGGIMRDCVASNFPGLDPNSADAQREMAEGLRGLATDRGSVEELVRDGVGHQSGRGFRFNLRCIQQLIDADDGAVSTVVRRWLPRAPRRITLDDTTSPPTVRIPLA